MSRWQASTRTWVQCRVIFRATCSHLSQFLRQASEEVDMQVVRAGPTASPYELGRSGTRVAHTRSVANVSRFASPSRQRGFSIIELLIVLFLFGLIATMVVPPVNSYYQRSRIEGAATEVRNFLVGAQTLAFNTNGRVTVTLQQEGTRWVVDMVPVNPPSGGTPAAAMQRHLELPDYVVLSGLGLGANLDWHEYPSGSFNIVCAPSSRTEEQTGPTAFDLVATARTLRMTHRSMSEGRLSPRLIYEIQVTPLWSVQNLRRLAS